MGTNVGYTENGVDIGAGLVDRSYLIDRYPELVDTFKQAGLWTWGDNFNGQLGDNTRVSKSSPVQTVAGGADWKLISAGISYTSAIKTDGTLWSWGINSSSQLGDNTTAAKSSPVQTVAGGTNWKQLSCGFYHAAAIKTDGSLWLWGNNTGGVLGDNTTTNKSSPVQTVAAGTNWKLVSPGWDHTAAIKTDGTLWLWGGNTGGQLGDNTSVSKSSPVQTVSGGTNWRSIACGGGTAAIKTDGTLWTWGAGNVGYLGDNTIIAKSSPVQTVSGGTNWRQVAIADYHTAAIKTDGTLWTWGQNNSGQLGNGTITNRSSPAQTVSSGTNWLRVSCGSGYTAAIKTDGSLWLWGQNDAAKLGDNTTIAKSSPVQTVSGGTNWTAIACGYFTAVAIRTNSDDYI